MERRQGQGIRRSLGEGTHHVCEVDRPVAQEGLQLLQERRRDLCLGQEGGRGVELVDMVIEVLRIPGHCEPP